MESFIVLVFRKFILGFIVFLLMVVIIYLLLFYFRIILFNLINLKLVDNIEINFNIYLLI